jgi:GTP cyclohydrolase I
MKGKMKEEAVDKEEAKKLFSEFMSAMGLDSDDEHLADTPRRVVDSRIDEIFRGIDSDPVQHLDKTFDDVEQYKGDAGWVIEKNINVQSMCAHHFLPFRGHAHVGYLPQDEVVGLSKLARVVDGFARRPQVQERLTNQIATAIYENLDPIAAVVVIESEHECMSIRGVKEPDASTLTSAVRGEAREGEDQDHLKQEFFDLVWGSE